MRNLKSLLILSVLFSFNYSQQSVTVDLDKLSFNLDQPGLSFTQDRYIDPEDTDSSLNYFLHMAFWAGAKTESGISVVSGDGNPTVKEFTEWQFNTPTYKIEDISADTSVVSIYRSVYHDNSGIPGHNPVGLSIEQRSYVYKAFPALIYEYTVTSTQNLDSLILGMYLDFDLPEQNQTSDPYNDHVLADPSRNSIYMANNGNWDEGSIPAVVNLSSGQLRYKILGSLKKHLTDKEKWDIISDPTYERFRKTFETRDDYRFIIFSEPLTIKAGDPVTFSLALVHTKGQANSNKYINELKRWYKDHPLLFKQTGHQLTKTDKIIPEEISLSESYPNPFNPSTSFYLRLPEPMRVNISIYDINGRLVKTLIKGDLNTGKNRITWHGDNDSGADVSTGIYILKVTTLNFNQSKKLVLMR